MNASISFYRDVLGFSVFYQSEHWASLGCGDFKMGLHAPLTNSRPLGSLNSGWVIGILVEDLNSLKNLLDKAGVWVDTEVHETPSGLAMMFQDPDGNMIQAMQPKN
jgi:predicted enzyme related to lactoylglutathione lyase